MFRFETRPPQRNVQLTGCAVVFMLFFMACVVPFLFANLANTALRNLHLTREAAWIVLFASVFGSVINIPIVRYPLDEEVEAPVSNPPGGWMIPPMQSQRLRVVMTVAVNVGGCIVPVFLTIWLMRFIFESGMQAVGVMLIGVVANSLICYRVARPVPGLGIALPLFVPPAVALLITWVGLGMTGLTQDIRSPVAFVIGISGPLIGADLMNWRKFKTISAAMVSIGGAGTWDGIVLSGLLASLLA